MAKNEEYKEITQEEYRRSFEGRKAKLALAHALDIRKFEIDLYWKRATYFWTLIAADLVGYGALQVSTTQNERTDDLSVLLSCIGIIFSFGWFCANKGSKQWQENWESHVDMLEDDITGPLYKIVLSQGEPVSKKEKCVAVITGPGTFSVSKINQIISVAVTILWIVLLFSSLGHFSTKAAIAWTHVVYVSCTVACCAAFLFIGRTGSRCQVLKAKLRSTQILPSQVGSKENSQGVSS